MKKSPIVIYKPSKKLKAKTTDVLPELCELHTPKFPAEDFRRVVLLYHN